MSHAVRFSLSITAAAGHFVLPLLHLAATVAVRCKVAAQPVLSVMIGT
jgi:hypothetical protein